jgi:hypothetical protein
MDAADRGDGNWSSGRRVVCSSHARSATGKSGRHAGHGTIDILDPWADGLHRAESGRRHAGGGREMRERDLGDRRVSLFANDSPISV